MKESGKTIFVYDDFSSPGPLLMGTLYVDVIRGSETYSFEYESSWLEKTSAAVLLDPDLMYYKGRQFPSDRKIFGIFSDSSPDRWGRVLMMRRERIKAEKEGRKPDKLYESDYLMGVYDETRMGGLRFKRDISGPFLSSDTEMAAPPWTTLRTLEEASRNLEDNESVQLSEKWLNLLLEPGSSLGGARPKASIVDNYGKLWISKFPSRKDDYDTGAWEMVVHKLASLCALDVPEARLEKYSSLGSTFIVKRFDREGKKRRHFASAMTLLGKRDGETASYLDLVAFLKSYGAETKKDLRELWRRIVFFMAVSNTDDHLRNHGFIYTPEGWRLSPLYDVNPVPYGHELSLSVDELNNSIEMELALSVAAKFGINSSDAETYAGDIVKTVRENWEKTALSYGLTRSDIEMMRPAFSLN